MYYSNDTPIPDICCKYNTNMKMGSLASNNATGNVLYIAYKQIIQNFQIIQNILCIRIKGSVQKPQ